MLEAGENVGSYPDLTEGPPAWHKPGDARYGFQPYACAWRVLGNQHTWSSELQGICTCLAAPETLSMVLYCTPCACSVLRVMLVFQTGSNRA